MRKYIGLSIVGVLSIILLWPLFLDNHFAIGVSSDMEFHTRYIQAMIIGVPTWPLAYQGDFILWLVLSPIIVSTGWNINEVYIAFNFLVLVGVAFSLYYVTKQLAGEIASWLVVPFALFVTPSILVLFKYGVIFSIINMYIILPWAIYFAVRWFVNKGKVRLILAVALFSLFSLFHTSALYLPYVIALIIGAVVIYRFVFKKHLDIMPILLFGIGIILVNAIFTRVFLAQTPDVVSNTITDTSGVVGSGEVPSFVNFIQHIPSRTRRFVEAFLSYPATLLLVLAIIQYSKMWRKVKLNEGSRLFGIVLVAFIFCLAIALAVVSELAVGKVGGDLAVIMTYRITLDLVTIIGVLVACLIGLVVQNVGWTKLGVVSVAIITLVTASNVVVWFR